MDPARLLLCLLTERLPPPKGKHHSLLLREDDPTGLSLYIWIGEEGHLVHLDQDDLKKSPTELATGIVALLV